MPHPRLAVVDIETTGPNAGDGDRIIQIAAVIIDNRTITREYNMYINPEMPIPDNIQSLTGIDDEDVADAPTFKQVAALWYERLKDCLLVAHNLTFDLNFLKRKFAQYLKKDYDPMTLDTLSAAKVFLPQAKGFNLTEICHWIGVDMTDAHNALADARGTTFLLGKIFQNIQQLSSQERQQLRPVLQQLSPVYGQLLSHPEDYLFDDGELLPLLVPVEESREKFHTNSTDASLANYIRQKGFNNRINLIDNYPLTIRENIQKTFIHQMMAQKDLLLIVPSRATQMELYEWLAKEFDDQLVRLLLKSSDFINRPAFDRLVAQVDDKDLNPHELIIVSAVMFWLFTSQTGCLNELNPVIDIAPILERHVTNARHLDDRYFYQRHLQQLKDADVILAENIYFYRLINRKKMPLAKSIFDRTLIDLDIEDTLSCIRYLSENQLNVSEWFVNARSDINHLFQDPADRAMKEALTPHLKGLAQSFYELQNYLINQVKGKDHFQEGTRYSFALPKESLAPIKQSLVHLRRVSELLIAEYGAYDRSQVTKLQGVLNIPHLRAVLRNIHGMLDDSMDGYWLFEGDYSHHQFYQVKLRVGSHTMDLESLTYLTRFHKTYAFNLHRKTIHARSHLQELSVNAVSLPNIYAQERLELTVPLGEMINVKSSNKWEGLKKFLEDLPADESDLVLVLTSNAADVGTAHHQLVSHSLSAMVFAKSISGSLRRVKRQALEMDPSVVIMNFREMMREHWTLTEKKVTVVLLQIPFISPDSADLHMEKAFGDYTAEQVFQHQILPQCIGELSGLFDYVTNHLAVDKFYLLDERFYSERYSSQIREGLKHQIVFNEKISKEGMT